MDKCGICGMVMQAGKSWIIRCKEALANPRVITCPVGAKLYICQTCSGERTSEMRHSAELWRAPTSPSIKLKQFAVHRLNGASSTCTLQISPLIRNVEYTVSFGADAGKIVGIPEELVNGPTPDFKGIWKLLKGDTMTPKYTFFTVGSGSLFGQAVSSDAVFSRSTGASGTDIAGNKGHFHVGVATHGGTGTTERVWYNATGKTIKFSNILEG